eukprot:155289_1
MSIDDNINLEYQELTGHEDIQTRQDSRKIPRQRGYKYDSVMAQYRLFQIIKIHWFIIHMIFIITLFSENHFYRSYYGEYLDEYKLCGHKLSNPNSQLLLLVCEGTLTCIMMIIFFVKYRQSQYLLYESNDIGSVSLSTEQWNSRKLYVKKQFHKLCATDIAIWILNNIIILTAISMGVRIHSEINKWDDACCKKITFDEENLVCSTPNHYSYLIFIFIPYILLEILIIFLLRSQLEKQSIINWINTKFTCL